MARDGEASGNLRTSRKPMMGGGRTGGGLPDGGEPGAGPSGASSASQDLDRALPTPSATALAPAGTSRPNSAAGERPLADVNGASATAAPLQPSVLREVDDEARALADGLLRGARSAALGTLDPSGAPFVSLTAFATDVDGAPLLLVSALSAHAGHLAAEPRASLLLTRPGRGDPLAHPRLTLVGRALDVSRETEDGRRVRRRVLARNPKAALYVDFPDFRFLRVEIAGASLNGGFGRAYALEPADLLAPANAAAALAAIEEEALAHMNGDHSDALAPYAATLGGSGEGWRAVALDPNGLDLARGDEGLRLRFPRLADGPDALRTILAEAARAARAT